MGKRYYDNYDYEEAYKEQCKKLEEAEMERWMKEGWVNCLYRTSTYKSTNTESNTTLLESMVYPSFKFKADMPKTEKKRETSPSQSNLNDKNARRYLIRLANINFGKGDIWATFGWNNGLLPETYEDAKKDVVNFIRRINRKRKKLGLENAKYIYIIAFEEYTRPHFHLLISGGIDRDELERMWGKCDRPNTRNISPDENFLLTGLATYITQNPHGTKRWCPSKNLKKPDEPKRSYSKFRKAKVEKMAFDSSVLQAEMEKAYRKYYECGTFELHAPATEKNIRLLQPGNVIRPKGKDEAAVIRGDQTEEESTLVNEVVRNGYFLPIYFNDRLTGPMFTFNGTCEDAMRYMINRMAAVPLLEVAPGIGDATKITFQATYKNVLTYPGKRGPCCYRYR